MAFERSSDEALGMVLARTTVNVRSLALAKAEQKHRPPGSAMVPRLSPTDILNGLGRRQRHEKTAPRQMRDGRRAPLRTQVERTCVGPGVRLWMKSSRGLEITL